MRRRSKERGALLGIVMVLLVVILAAGVFAFYGLKSDTTAAGNDRLMRQLFDCAEEGLQQGKVYYSQASQRSQWSTYFESDVHTSLPIKTPLNVNVGLGSAESGMTTRFITHHTGTMP